MCDWGAYHLQYHECAYVSTAAISQEIDGLMVSGGDSRCTVEKKADQILRLQSNNPMSSKIERIVQTKLSPIERQLVVLRYAHSSKPKGRTAVMRNVRRLARTHKGTGRQLYLQSKCLSEKSVQTITRRAIRKIRGNIK